MENDLGINMENNIQDEIYLNYIFINFNIWYHNVVLYFSWIEVNIINYVYALKRFLIKIIKFLYIYILYIFIFYKNNKKLNNKKQLTLRIYIIA